MITTPIQYAVLILVIMLVAWGASSRIIGKTQDAVRATCTPADVQPEVKPK